MVADATDRITIDEAFHILLQSAKPHAAKARLNAAIITGKVDLWANDTVLNPDLFESSLRVGANAADGRWKADLHMIKGVSDFHTTLWMVTRADVMTLLAETKPQKHAGGKPSEYDRNEIRAAAFVALANFLKKGAIPEKYSGNDLADEVAVILGDHSPKDTLLKEVLNPLLNHIKLKLNSGR
jgi:hypothetical protein